MKTLYTAILVLSINAFSFSQDLVSHLNSAESSYKSGDNENARFELQQSLVELDKIIGEEILKILPQQLNGIDYDDQDDNVSGSILGYSGVYVNRSWMKDAEQISVEIITNSPMLSMVNSFLTNPLIAGMAKNDNQKVIKINGYKGMLTKDEMEEGSYDVQIPISDSMVTLNYDGAASEADVLKAANAIDLVAISKLIRGN